MNAGSIKDLDYFIKELKNRKQNFVVKRGTFSGEIQLNGEKFFFADTKRKFEMFHAVNALKKDLKPHLDFFGQKPKGLNYFFYKTGFQEKKGEFFNIDIKSAYPTALYKTNLVSEKTQERISKLTKPDRLAVIGMLAYEPDLFTFENGKIINHTKQKNDFTPCFFYCVKQIENLMLSCIEEIPNHYFFTWVDGIFFEPCENSKEKIEKVMQKADYKYSFENCQDLNFNLLRESINFTYLKGVKKEPKTLTFPNPNEIARKKYELLKKIRDEENKNSFSDFLENYFVLNEKKQIIF